MAADIVSALLGANLALAAAILAVLILRPVVRRLAGSRAAYALWIATPAAYLAALAPARQAETLPFQPPPLRSMAEAVAVVVQPTPSLDLSAPLAAAWVLGALLGLALILWRQRRAIRLLGRLSPEAGGMLRSARSAIGPAVVGVWRPRIVLPADFEQRFDAAEQALILTHERAHLAGKDAQINAVVALMRVLSWFNPLAHLAAQLVRADQEMACDEAVVGRRPSERKTYAEALLKTQISQLALPLGCQWPARATGSVKARIHRLTRKTPGRLRRALGAALASSAAIGAGCAAWAVQPPDGPIDILLPIPKLVAAAEPRKAPAPAPAAAPRPAARRAAPARPAPAAPAGEPFDITGETMIVDRATGSSVWSGAVRVDGAGGVAGDKLVVNVNGVPAPQGFRLGWLKPADRVEVFLPKEVGDRIVMNISLSEGGALSVAAPAPASAVAPRPAPRNADPNAGEDRLLLRYPANIYPPLPAPAGPAPAPDRF